MSDNKFWITFWFMAMLTILSVISIFVYRDHIETRTMLSKGYVLKVVPIGYGRRWIKDVDAEAKGDPK